MSLQDLVHSTVSADGAALKQVGFGVMLLAAYHNTFPELARSYDELSGMVSDGFATSDPAYLMAQRAFSQDPRPDHVVVGRLATAFTQTVKWVPTITATGYVQTVTLTIGGVVHTVTYTNAGGSSVASIIAAMKTAVDAASITGLTTTDSGGHTYLQFAMTAGKILYFSNWTGTYEDVTADPGVTADLTAIQLYNDEWAGVVLDLNAKAIQHSVATFIESNIYKIAAFQTSDWQASDSGQTVDIGDVLQAASYARSISYFDKKDTGSYMAVGAMAERFPHDPGDPPGAGGTWMGKTIKGAVADTLTTTEKANLRAKNYVVYEVTAGRSHTLDGKSASGEFIDVTRFLDWVNVRIQEAVATVKLNSERVPYTDFGISLEQAAISGVLTRGVQAGGFSDSPYPVVTVPKAADVPSVDKQNRVLKNVKWSAKMAGAIHLTNVGGTVTF